MIYTKKNNKNKRGYTLVEVLISAAILVVAVTAVAVIISRGSKINREDMLRRRAFQVMEEILERPDLSHLNYSNLLGLIGTDKTTITEDLPDETLLSSQGSDQVKAKIRRRLEKVLYTYPPTGAQVPGIEVTITITYEGNSESLSTIVTNVPLQ